MTADITRINTAAEAKLLEQFRSATGVMASTAEARRSGAIEMFAKVGLPHRRNEAWHYTDLRTIMRDAHAPTLAPQSEVLVKARAALDREPAKGTRFVLLDGHFVPELSILQGESGLKIRSVIDVLGEGASDLVELLAASAVEARESVLSLNAAFLQGGAIIDVTAGVAIAVPVDLVLMTSGTEAAASTTRSLIRVGSDARVMVTERHIALGSAAAQSNHVVVIDVGDRASLDHIVTTAGITKGFQQVSTVIAQLGAESSLLGFALVSGSGFVRRQSFVSFNGAHAKMSLRGVVLIDKDGHVDSTMAVTHKGTNCESRELFKHILDDQSTGVFQGKVIVAPGAQKTDGKMMSRAIFLAEGANMYNKPELEIFADDVVCGHGATAGFLNEEQLFYLQARGIPKKEAEALLLEAFAAEAIDDVGTDEIRAALTESVGQWLRQRQI